MARRTTAVIWLKRRETKVPAIKIIEDERRQQVLITFVQLEGEHITLHRQPHGRILRTHYSETKPKAKWDDARVAIARKLGYRDPERHGRYYIHSPLIRIFNIPGYTIGGRRLDLRSLKRGKKYLSWKRLVIELDGENAMVGIYLSTPDNRREGMGLRVKTFLGELVFERE